MNHEEQIDDKYQPTEQDLALRLTINRINAATNYGDQIAILERFLRRQLWEHGIGNREDYLLPRNLPQLCIEGTCNKPHLTNQTCEEAANDPEDLIDKRWKNMPEDLNDKKWGLGEDADV